MIPMLFDTEGGGTLEQRIVRHVSRYRITTPHVTKRLFFDMGGSSDHLATLLEVQATLDELVSLGKLERISNTKKKIQSASKKQNVPPKPKWTFTNSVYVHPGHKIKAGDDLARLWFCCLDKQRRHFTVREELEALFRSEGIKPPYHNYFHAIAHEEGGPVLYRIYICRAEWKSAGQQIRKIIGTNAREFRHWIDQGSYGVAILVPTKQKKNEINQRLQNSYGGQPPLHDKARLIVSVAPTEGDYEQSIVSYERDWWQ